ncbi:MAG: alpha/beta hydrolase [Gammaproteobacteria bacterium]|nr:alpha/beta hydrolase [Gammaproteobacteria bacterium]
MPDNSTDRSLEIEPRTITLSDGRRLSFQCYGADRGHPIYFMHGFPGSRLQAALVRLKAEQAGVKLIAIDRPGFGRSSFHGKRSILGFAADVEQLADHLGHGRFGVIGVSCGGAYALACAHELLRRVYWVGLLAAIGPLDVPDIRVHQLPFLKVLFALARRSAWLARPLLLPDWLMFRAFPLQAVRAVSSILTEPDRKLLNESSEVAGIFGESLTEAYRQGLRGSAQEAHLIATARGFSPADIDIPVDIYQGGLDRHVPPAMGRYLAEQLPRGRFHYFPEEGHLSVFVNRFADLLASIRTITP